MTRPAVEMHVEIYGFCDARFEPLKAAFAATSARRCGRVSRSLRRES
jgi:hypothetical protein